MKHMYLLIEVEVFVHRGSQQREREVGADEKVYEIWKHRVILHVTVDHIFPKLQNVRLQSHVISHSSIKT